jgi:hypothetical protein
MERDLTLSLKRYRQAENLWCESTSLSRGHKYEHLSGAPISTPKNGASPSPGDYDSDMEKKDCFISLPEELTNGDAEFELLRS